MRSLLTPALAAVAALALPGLALAHDHPAPAGSTDAPLATTFNSGGPGAEWDLITTLATGNPHSDIEFFTQGGDTYVSAGTLGTGANGGGQSIFRLTEGGEVDPSFVSSHPSASCLSNPLAALGLQHDVEAAPKGEAILNTPNAFADRRDTQLLLDASDNDGRCHDQGSFGLRGAPQGGIEIVDVTDIANPVEIGLTSHIGEAHTVNVDPKRPHIAYAVTSDTIGVEDDGTRENEDPSDSDRTDLDGFEVIDLSSCMNFPDGTSVDEKRQQCSPDVFRYRYPSAAIALGHTEKGAVSGCHELEIYPNDLLTCGGINAGMLFDMSGAFDDNGTPDDFSDDRPRGTPLPCRVRESSSAGPFATGALVTDCVNGGTAEQTVDRQIPNWLAIGAPSLEGVQWLGSAHHQGRGGPFDATEDIDVNHEFELTQSGRFIIATDERGGGVVPPGASCTPGVDNTAGNGGLHAFAVDRLDTEPPDSPDDAFEAYARTSAGDKAIFRATPRTQPQADLCTAHVFQQVPDQNRIFMGWYTQGTQVVDFVENADGTFEFKEAGWFIPEGANTWTSHVFRVQDNEDGTFTYWGATGDFNLGTAGRSAVDVYKVTLPAPPEPAAATEPAPAAVPGEQRASDRGKEGMRRGRSHKPQR